MEISKCLKDARIKKNITQEDLAEELGVSRQTISSWENGKSYPDIVSIIKSILTIIMIIAIVCIFPLIEKITTMTWLIFIIRLSIILGLSAICMFIFKKIDKC